jgi:hypothetical protein
LTGIEITYRKGVRHVERASAAVTGCSEGAWKIVELP